MFLSADEIQLEDLLVELHVTVYMIFFFQTYLKKDLSFMEYFVYCFSQIFFHISS